MAQIKSHVWILHIQFIFICVGLKSVHLITIKSSCMTARGLPPAASPRASRQDRWLVAPDPVQCTPQMDRTPNSIGDKTK